MHKSEECKAQLVRDCRRKKKYYYRKLKTSNLSNGHSRGTFGATRMEQFHENCIPIFFSFLSFAFWGSIRTLCVCTQSGALTKYKKKVCTKERKIKEHENRECAIKGEDTISALWSRIKNGRRKIYLKTFSKSLYSGPQQLLCIYFVLVMKREWVRGWIEEWNVVGDIFS